MPSKAAPARAAAPLVPGAAITGDVDRLLVVLGDQLDVNARLLREADRKRDAILMMEVREEATHVPSHRQRTALFLAAMRHFATARAAEGWRVRYVTLDDPHNTHSFTGEVERAATAVEPARLAVTHPGEHRVKDAVASWERAARRPVDVLPDEHFLSAPDDFAAWAKGRQALIMEYFYREQRRRHGLLVKGGKPVGGAWNFDAQNRESFRTRPKTRPPRRFPPDATTRGILGSVQTWFPSAPGSIDRFGWPVVPAEAQAALKDFIAHRLADFGRYQDAMWSGEPFLNHSLLSPALNLKLIAPQECLDAAAAAYQRGAPLNSVEAFVRQILGWREFIRGVYWREGREYGERNLLGANGRLPSFYWTAETDMRCLAEAIGQVLEYGYGHHIQRLMVTGNFALLAGVHPRSISDWYLGMYVDGVDWVTLPNTLGMVMHADGGIVGTKPYAASGKYIQRMSNYCAGCRYDPGKRTGENACPFTTFYWDFLIRHRERFRANRRMTMMLKHVDRMDAGERRTIRQAAANLRRKLGVE